MPPYSVTGGTVAVSLPDKNAKPTPAGVQQIRDELGAIRAYRPRAITTYTFYEVLDDWLGPWKEKGYPIGYGKYDNVLFTSSPSLMSRSEGKLWVEKTTVCLQDALIELVASVFEAGKLGTFSEPELRKTAFESHVGCYVSAGLSRVLVLDPFLIPIVGAIPTREFVPFSGNAAASWKQAVQAAVAAPVVSVGWGLAAIMPAHSGMLARAASMDRQKYLRDLTFGTRMARLKQEIESGRFDNLPWINQTIRELERMELTDARERQFVQEVLGAAQLRRAQVLARYQRERSKAPKEVREAIDGVMR